jgi:hypothetical protein
VRRSSASHRSGSYDDERFGAGQHLELPRPLFDAPLGFFELRQRGGICELARIFTQRGKLAQRDGQGLCCRGRIAPR